MMLDIEDTADNNAKREQARRQHDSDETLRRLMGHRNGRAYMYHLAVETCHVFRTSFQAGPPEETFFRLGEQHIGQQLMAHALEACPDLWALMLAEAKQHEDRLAAAPAQEERKREEQETIAMRMQGFELAPPGGVPPSGRVK